MINSNFYKNYKSNSNKSTLLSLAVLTFTITALSFIYSKQAKYLAKLKAKYKKHEKIFDKQNGKIKEKRELNNKLKKLTKINKNINNNAQPIYKTLKLVSENIPENTRLKEIKINQNYSILKGESKFLTEINQFNKNLNSKNELKSKVIQSKRSPSLTEFTIKIRSKTS